jgi:hypothetical protein
VEISGFEDYPLYAFHRPRALWIKSQQNTEHTVSIRDSHTSSSKQDKFLNQIILVVVMTVVETWKAQQAP